MDSKDKVEPAKLKEEVIAENSNNVKKIAEFKKSLQTLINCHSMEQFSNTPDFILADHMVQSMLSFGDTMARRDKWRDYKAPVTETVND